MNKVCVYYRSWFLVTKLLLWEVFLYEVCDYGIGFKFFFIVVLFKCLIRCVFIEGFLNEIFFYLRGN